MMARLDICEHRPPYATSAHRRRYRQIFYLYQPSGSGGDYTHRHNASVMTAHIYTLGPWRMASYHGFRLVAEQQQEA